MSHAIFKAKTVSHPAIAYIKPFQKNETDLMLFNHGERQLKGLTWWFCCECDRTIPFFSAGFWFGVIFVHHFTYIIWKQSFRFMTDLIAANVPHTVRKLLSRSILLKLGETNMVLLTILNIEKRKFSLNTTGRFKLIIALRLNTSSWSKRLNFVFNTRVYTVATEVHKNW